METLTENATVLLLLALLAITFIQSGLDKVLDWRGNLGWLKEHFSETPLRNGVPALLLIVTLAELGAGGLCLVGGIQVALGKGDLVAFWGGVLSCIALLMLFFGQRMARDYEGARTLVVYFIPAVFLVFLLQP